MGNKIKKLMCHFIGQPIVFIESTESTNNYATRQVRENEVKEGTVFLTYKQTAGRGQVGNSWESAPGKNLSFSILLRPFFLDIHRQYLLSKVVCLSLEKVLNQLVDNVKIKWPNDIYVGDQKIAGVLIENAIMNGQISQSIIGIGLNVNQAQFYSDAPNPVSLKMLTGREFDLEQVLQGILAAMNEFYAYLEAGEFEKLDQLFYERMYRLNEWHAYRDENHHYTGMITGVNWIGQLKVQERDGTLHEYHFKEVSYL